MKKKIDLLTFEKCDFHVLTFEIENDTDVVCDDDSVGNDADDNDTDDNDYSWVDEYDNDHDDYNVDNEKQVNVE